MRLIGKDARYIVFGQNNHESDNTKEVVRVVKYDDDWNKLGQCSITSKNVYEPFAKGPLRMTENDGILYIHTSRYIYWDAAAEPEEIHHEVNLTYAVDEELRVTGFPTLLPSLFFQMESLYTV